MSMEIVRKGFKALLVVAVARFIFQQLVKLRKIREMNGFITPKSVHNYVLGFAGEFKKNVPRVYHWRGDLFEEASKEEGKKIDQVLLIPPFWAPRPVIMNRDPALVKFILKDEFDSFVKSGFSQGLLFDLIGNGIFVINHGSNRPEENPKWVFQRKTASKIFTRKVFNGHVATTVEKNILKVTNQIEKSIDGKTDYDIKKAIYCFTMDSIGDIGFGFDLGTLDSEEVVPFSKAFDESVALLSHRNFLPGWDIPYFRLIHKSERIIKQGIAVLDELSYRIIKERKQDKNIEEKGDILSMFLQADPNLSDKYLRDIVLSFMLAGRDTSACTLSFLFFLLATHQEIQERLYQEIKEVLKGEHPTLESLKSLPYLDGVVFECLRLFPPVPQDPKCAAKDIILPDGRKICKDTMMTFEPFVMGRDETVYKNPNKFDPERWMQNGRNVQDIDQYAFPVFQAGPRICLGKDLAFFEIKMFLVEIMAKFSFDLPKEKLPTDWNEFKKDVAVLNGKPIYRLGVTLSYDGDMPLLFKRR